MKLRTKAFLAIFLIACAVVAAGLAVFTPAGTTLSDEDHFRIQRDNLLLIQKYLEERSPENPSSSTDLLKTVAELTGSRIRLLDSAGEILFDSSHESQGQFLDAGATTDVLQARETGWGTDRIPDQGGDDVLFVTTLRAEIGPPGEPAAFIRLESPSNQSSGPRADVIHIVIVCSILTLLGVVAVGIYLERSIARPLREMTTIVNGISSGDVAARITGSYEDDMNDLAVSINSMADKHSAEISNLERLERVRSEFLGNVSHELRTPLFSLQGFLETLIDGAVDDPLVNRQFLQKAMKHSDRLSSLLGDLVEISRIESGEMKMSFRYFSVNELLTGLVDEMRPSAEARQIKLVLESEFDDAAKVYGDKARLRQVMTNLVDNALKYTNAGGTVRCIASSLRNQCEILVRDTGRGIPQEHLSRIFERFYRVDRDRSREIGGTGLGLAIVKHIVEAPGSTIRVESTVGAGTTFAFTLKR